MDSPDSAKLETIGNWIFPGLTLFYRDTPLTSEQIGLYQPNLIIRNNFFVDCTPILSGLTGNTRYLIASSKAAALYTVSPNVELYQQHTINANSFFKVMDICQIGDKTQIILEHIPSAYLQYLTPNSTFEPMDSQLIRTGRQRFDQALAMEPDPRLTDDIWPSHVQLPLGIDPNNQLNDVNKPVQLAPEAEQLSAAINKLVDDDSGLNLI